MNIVERHIIYLLSRKDCVIIPGFGALLARTTGAVWDADTQYFTPRQRHFMFNGDLTLNDGILAASISRATGRDTQQSLNTIADTVADWHARMHRGESVILDNIGAFKYSEGETNICFVPATDSRLFATTDAWLPTIAIASVKQRNNDEHRHAIATFARPAHFSKVIAKTRRVASVAAILALLIGVCYIASTPIAMPEATQASLALLTPKKEVATATIDNHGPISISRSTNTELFTEVDTAARYAYQREHMPVASPQTTETVETSSTSGENSHININIADDDAYCIIVASLANAEDAATFISQNSHKGRLELMETTDGRYRVYAATAPNAAHARAIINDAQFAARYPSAWPCRR